MKQIIQTIPDMGPIIDTAIARLKTQPKTPLSPFAVDTDGTVQLCTAAAVAAAGFEVRFGPEVAGQFVDRLVEGGTPALYAGYKDLGLPAALCAEFKARNDGFSAAERSTRAIELLQASPSGVFAAN